ncbi:hypothetical protein CRUP_021055 [Coryphaenoides rupestris]|nr:hypothetical protein CRUP_021055 [Coryphaenoides rupestris]
MKANTQLNSKSALQHGSKPQCTPIPEAFTTLDVRERSEPRRVEGPTGRRFSPYIHPPWTLPFVMSLRLHDTKFVHMTILKWFEKANHAHTWWCNRAPLTVMLYTKHVQ